MDNLTPWQKYKQNLGDTRPWHIITDEPRASVEVAEKRFNICLECPEFINLTKQCKKCGCIMSIKTKLEKAICPLAKW